MKQASLLVVEVIVTRDEIKATLQASFHMIKVEGDNQIVVKVVLM